MAEGRIIEPYRVLFPIGVAYGFSGVLVWPLHFAGWISYPGSYHGLWMIGGFLMSFASGFMMTAVPKFTGTQKCSQAELSVAVALLIAGWFTFDVLPLMILGLLIFFARRYAHREFAPPPHFIFVGLGLICGLIGSIGMVLGAHGASLEILPFRTLFLQGMLFCLLIGVGARLLRVLLGFEPSPLIQIQKNIRQGSDAFAWFGAEAKPAIIAAFVLLVVGFSFEFVPGCNVIGRGMRGIVAIWVAVAAWRIHRLPRGRGVLAWSVWASSCTFVAGAVGYPFSGAHSLHVLHLLYIGGFGVTTLMVASRVILAHGGFPVNEERKSLVLAWTCGLGIFAALARAGAGFTEGMGYGHHLVYASFAWLIALALWGAWMGKRLTS